VNHQRPVNLDLASLKFPPMAIASIFHRLSGIALFLFFPVMLYFLKLSLDSSESYQQLLVTFEKPYVKFVLWAFSTALIYHVFAGIRHMLMDIGKGESLLVARISAQGVIAVACIGAIILGVWIW
jgi:succinate dehydrogenase / fumarate reductase cytochrome b subunit